ncbi:OLC1v1009116C1 [Oldenlandia corymbosa var. corymbosa]|uniref:OLC1v1009116C1 n=1 Tax=Oldenlandia corymbosa var. corymbosa TaxID=529605 RepID=A0AAV1DN39_OLDCO|nr:OLC1v1009116C1 [Oldenlandia corymbosa var. corymbosa]
MAKNIISLVLFLVAVLIASAPSANSIIWVGSLNTQGMYVTGNVTCSSTGNPPGPPADRANVTVTCIGYSTIFGQAITDSTGGFAIPVIYTPLLTSILSIVSPGPIPCSVDVKLPVDGCSALPSTGTLTAPIQMLSCITFLGGRVLGGVGMLYNRASSGVMSLL